MKSSTYLSWFRRLLILGAVVAAGAMAQGAGAMVPTPGTADISRPPDVRDTSLALAPSSTLVSRPPDVQDTAAFINSAAPDAFERFAEAHPYGLGLSSNTAAVSRPPDVADAALIRGTGSSDQSSTFAWDDWAIGIGTGAALAVLLGAALLMGQRRHRVQTA